MRMSEPPLIPPYKGGKLFPPLYKGRVREG
jgi:hypothetical protein